MGDCLFFATYLFVQSFIYLHQYGYLFYTFGSSSTRTPWKQAYLDNYFFKFNEHMSLTEHLVKMHILIQQVWVAAGEVCISSQLRPVLLVCATLSDKALGTELDLL